MYQPGEDLVLVADASTTLTTSRRDEVKFVQDRARRLP
jgi:hypothetical protein